MKSASSLLYGAWKGLIGAYLICFFTSVVAGFFLVTVLHLQPESLYQASTKRLSYALPVIHLGVRMGVDLGLLIFLWNTMAAMLTVSFIYSVSWFDPDYAGRAHGLIWRIGSGKTRMKLLCYLPGCSCIREESLRRAYVWLMIPLLGMILLGIESGIAVSTGVHLLGSFFPAFISLVPHGLIEIPTLALAGAIPFSAHLLVKRLSQKKEDPGVFLQVIHHRQSLPIKTVVCFIVAGLFAAGLVEAHVTTRIMKGLL
jgi:hypothetical protein